MKNKSFVLIALLMIVLAISGCGKSGNNHDDMSVMTDPIQVDLSWTPNEVKVGQTVEIDVVVTQKDRKVDDADEVMIEIAQEGNDGEHEKVPAKSVGDGKYVLEKAFDVEGTYSITSHVTVGPQHTMPTKKLNVTK